MSTPLKLDGVRIQTARMLEIYSLLRFVAGKLFLFGVKLAGGRGEEGRETALGRHIDDVLHCPAGVLCAVL